MTSREWNILGNDTGKPVIPISKEADGKYREIGEDNPLPVTRSGDLVEVRLLNTMTEMLSVLRKIEYHLAAGSGMFNITDEDVS